MKNEKDNLIKEHLEFAEKMKEEMATIRQLGEQKALSLLEKYNELNELFEQRPSRPEDLELIQQLQQDNLFKDEELKKAIEALKVYKLELINREENYNKMFNSQPIVGVMNVLGDRVNKQ